MLSPSIFSIPIPIPIPIPIAIAIAICRSLGIDILFLSKVQPELLTTPPGC
jgi:hypothetical protein